MSGTTSPTHPQAPDDGRLDLFLKASWGVGGLGTTSMLYLINMFVVFFLVRHVGLPAAVAGGLLAVTRLYDAIVDPLIGTLSDRSKGRWGRRRPWMLVGAVLSPLACIAVFNPPALAPGPGLYAAVLAALLLYCTGYSLFSIPYMAQGAEMTDHYGERAAVMAWRTFFVYGAGIVITAGAPALVDQLGGDRAAYSWMSVAAAAVVGATMLWVVVFTGRARVTPRSKEPMSPLTALRTALSNRPFVVVLMTKMTLQLGTAFIGASMLFFMSDVLRRGEGALALLGLVSNLVGIAAVPLWSQVLRRVERRPLFITLLALHAFTYLSWLLASTDEPQVVFVARAFMLGALGAGSVLVAMAMLADTIELDRLKTGQRREGMFVGAFELMQTTSFVVGPLVVGFAFSAAGLVPGPAGRTAQPQSALDMMRFAVSVVPAVCALAGIALMSVYRLDAATLSSLRAAAAPDAGAGGQRVPPVPSTMKPSAS
jgi:GPH family glycoside/pentoside/hexuronide:cation symporter